VALKAAASEQKGASGVLVVCESLHIREPTHATSPYGRVENKEKIRVGGEAQEQMRGR
jgi:hypothetical protein